MVRKVAILTQPLGHNYGGIIQNFALQFVLKEIGYIPITIDRKKERSGLIFYLKMLKIFGKYYLKDKGKGIPPTPKVINIICKENFRFMKENMAVTEPILSDFKLKEVTEKLGIDTFVVGSDQVWRPKYSPNIYNYYFDFITEDDYKKLVYAASFGTDSWEYNSEETERCRMLAQKIDAISVREKGGVKLCSDFLNVNAINVLDPTLLLDSKQYDNIINRPYINMGLFSYVLDVSGKKNELIKKIAEVLCCSITNSQALGVDDKSSQNLEDFIMPPIENWLQGFRDAEFVITDSFHGTVFSILNRKPFFSIINSKRGASRFYSLLNLLGLQNRIIDDVENFDFRRLKDQINYDEVYLKLKIEKQKSLEFLTSNLIK